MISLPAAILVCCLVVAVGTSAVYTQPLLRDIVQQDPPTNEPSPGLTAFTMCWDGRNIIDECQKHSTLIRQLLYKLLHKMKTDAEQSEGDRYMTEVDLQEDNSQVKKRQDEPSGFYSNW